MTQPLETPKEMQKIIDVKEEEIPELQKLANKHDVILLAFIASYVPRRYSPSASGRATMNLVDEFGIETVLMELKRKVKNFRNKKLYLLVNSMGGSVPSAYKTATAVRESFNDITVFVPHYALSGGTLLALSGNRIRMGIMSQVSGLDVQILYKGQYVSVNSLFRARGRLNNEFKTKTVDEVPYPYRHLVESLDPIIIEEWTGAQDEVEYYVREILEKSGYTKTEIESMVRTLMFGLPTHGFVIKYSHAKKIGIKVEPHNMDEYVWNLMRNWLSEYMTKETDKHFIRYVIPKKITQKSKTKLVKRKK